eukprot:CAMPEP_0172450050 /NCGR_PEP_ID=MMETSP1065-20121228/8567_1 /TAXON_ID=265537 /ORGANISM="Amphiprora paludosa, Strain CCMP125" /LENGTH=277 /DNA_ID=CAMNT_0013201819 /DNA_START=53 /DNA_END=886 /DNA_ORIENTATION=-
MKWHPSASTLGIRPDQMETELLTVEIAGVRSLSIPNQVPGILSQPSSLLSAMSADMVQGASNVSGSSTMANDNPNDTVPTELEWLEQFSLERPLVSCQLLGRRVPVLVDDNTTATKSKKRRIPGLEIDTTDPEQRQRLDPTASLPPQIAIARLYFRSPSTILDAVRLLFFPTDLAQSLIRMGRACVVTGDEGLVTAATSSNQEHSYRVADTTNSVRDLQRDVAYVEQLHKAEYQAVAEERGIWQQPTVRELRSDVVEEVEFQTKASMLQKAWRWIRG